MRIIESSKEDVFQILHNNRNTNIEFSSDVEKVVREILNDVKNNGDSAVKKYTLRFDGTESISQYTQVDFERAYNSIDDDFREVLNKAAQRIRSFHTNQEKKDYCLLDGESRIGQITRPLARVGLYVPGGTASYPSSVLMNAIPAKIAGVSEVVIVSPPSKEGVNVDILAAAHIAEVDCLYAIGGAQAVGALAYGTESIKRVDRIVGPGNIYVATAKRLVYGICDIDMIAGPSEITIIADSSANPKYIAADLLSQAEHDILSSSILVTNSQSLAKKVNRELNKQALKLDREGIINKALDKNGMIIIAKDIDECINIANHIAPEHLEIMLKEHVGIIERILNAGSVFIGGYTPEAIGDYIAGTNHVLPTSGSARFFSPLSVDSFCKKIQYVYYSKSKLEEDAADVILFAEREGLTAHANSVRIRLEKDEE